MSAERSVRALGRLAWLLGQRGKLPAEVTLGGSFTAASPLRRCRDSAIIVPTFNRSRFVATLLRYYRELGAPCTIVVADSSSGEERLKTRTITETVGAEFATYHALPEDMHFREKFRRSLEGVSQPFVAFCGDDDFIAPSGFQYCVDFLRAHPDYALASGHSWSIAVGGSEQPIPIYYPQNDLPGETARERLKQHLNRYAPTFYSVHRTPELAAHLSTANANTDESQFYELLPSCLAVITGKAARLPVPYMLRQVHAASSASYLKPPPFADFLLSPEFSGRYTRFRDNVSGALAQKDALSRDDAVTFVNEAYFDYLVRIALPAQIAKSQQQTLFSGGLVRPDDGTSPDISATELAAGIRLLRADFP
jgi:glycosyltransferase domain-containing protein